MAGAERVINLMMIAAVALPLLAVIALTALDGIRTWDQSLPVLPIPRESWRASYESLGTPNDDRLWQGSAFRDDGTHWARVATRQGSDYWIGTEISAKLAADAAAQQANHLIIGYFNADFEVWVDGQRYLEGKAKGRKFPAIITLPPASLTTGRPLRVAVRVVHTAGSLYPDALATNRYEGLTTSVGAEAYLMAENVENQLRPALFFGAYFVLGILAIAAWTSHRMRKDFLYVGLYALFHAMLQLLDSNVSTAYKTLEMARYIKVVTLFYEGGLALGFGLAWARTRQGVVAPLLGTIAVLPWLVIAFVSAPVLLRDIAQALHAWYVPACFALGAAVCFVQSAALLFRETRQGYQTRRGLRLASIGIALLALGLGYWLEAATAFSITDYAAWYRLSNIVLIGFFFVMSMIDLGELDRLARHAPISKFHRAATLPNSVSGALVNIDVKGSEELIRKGAELGQSGQYLLVCLSHMWNAITTHGGIVLQTDGDALVAFFEDQDEPSAIARAITAASAVGRDLERLSEQFSASGVLTNGTEIKVRGAIAYGSIKPVWQEAGDQRTAAWTGVGNANIFLEAARLAELERQIPAAQGRSAIVMGTDAVLKIPSGTLERMTWAAEGQPMTGKHGKNYVVSAFIVSDKPADLMRRAG